MLERLRSRPRGERDAPSLRAFFPPDPTGVRDVLERLISLMAALEGETRYIDTWREIRTPQDQANGTGIFPTRTPEDWIAYTLDQEPKIGDDLFQVSITADSRRVALKDPTHYSAGLNYEGGALLPQPPKLSLYCADTDPDHNMTLEEYLRVIEVIVAWQTPVYIAVGPGSYGIYDRVFDHRAWDGWLGWFPATIHKSDLPDHALAFPVGSGTVVATQETNVIARLEDHRARAQAVEVALVELEVLPTLAALNGQ